MTAHWTRPRPVRVRTTAGHLELEATSIQSATATALELHPGAKVLGVEPAPMWEE